MTPRLLRRVNHDPASKDFPAAIAPIATVAWEHLGPILDQGNLGSCTGNATADALNTRPLYREALGLLNEDDAVGIYSLATHYDRIWGHYPPKDTGASGLAAAKAARHMRFISSYRHAFGIQHTLGALSLTPVIIGVPWMTDMFNPDGDGFLHPTGDVEGGHEVALIGNDTTGQFVTVLNSWGAAWGDNGTAKLAWDDLDLLLSQKGDCTVLIP